MPDFATLIAQGANNAWFFIPSAIVLGALHGLEPGHSKTMMAAFIVAIRGTVWQAVLLGLAATVSHTLVVWAIALGGLYFYQGLDAETVEPYFQLLSALIIIGLALWMIQRTWSDQKRARAMAEHDHRDGGDHGHSHDHGHPHGHDEKREINTGHGVVEVEIFETGQQPRWRFRTLFGEHWKAAAVVLTTERPDGTTQRFTFADKGDYLESTEDIPEPHQFTARVSLSHGSHGHDYDLSFAEDGGPLGRLDRALDQAIDGYQDAHELAHANDIKRRFANQKVTTWQIVLFGITGGLLPCPAAITVLLICLQLKEIPLGAVLVLCFSIGLAITLVTVGAVAAIGSRHATKRFPWLSAVAAKAPYLSGVLIILVGLYVGWHGYLGVVAGHA